MSERLRIGVDLGMSVQIRGVDWLKPTVHAEIDFDGMPDEDTLKERWRFLWEDQVAPQADQLLDILQRELARRLGPYLEPELHQPQKSQSQEPRNAPPPPPSGEAYG